MTDDPIDLLIEECKRQELNSQERLYRYCYPLYINTCLRYSNDLDGAGIIFNNAFLRIFKSIQQYQPKQKARAWIKTIVVHCCIDYVKKRHKLKEVDVEGREEEIGAIEDQVLHKMTLKEITQIIQEIPPATAAAFNLFVFEQLTHAEIATLLGISENTSKWHVNAGRKYVKERIETFSKLK